jgi:integrase
MVDLRAQEGTAARALECAILCVSCSAEIRGMQWSELAGNVWVIPASRIKSGREHRIPLSAAASALIEYMRERWCNNFVFPGAIKGKPLSREAFSEVIQRFNNTREAQGLPRWTDPKHGNRDVVAHGFRSCFKDWAGECTSFRDAVSEAALSHVSADKVNLAYERTTFEQQRRELAELWAQFCACRRSMRARSYRCAAHNVGRAQPRDCRGH